MPVPPDPARRPGLCRQADRLRARTASRPRRRLPRQHSLRIVAAPPPVAAPAGRDPASGDARIPSAGPCNVHSAAAREAASFNPKLDRARAIPAPAPSTARLRAAFHGLPTRRSAKRSSPPTAATGPFAVRTFRSSAGVAGHRFSLRLCVKQFPPLILHSCLP